MTKLADRREEELFKRVAEILESARCHVARSVNSAMVHAYWLIGREIVEVEQKGKKRAGYGDQLLERLSAKLTSTYRKGFSTQNLRRFRQFYLTYPDGSRLPDELGGPKKRSALPSESQALEIRAALPSESTMPGSRLFPPSLGWSHYTLLMRTANLAARTFYEIEAAREGWSTRELERQIASLLFERLAKSRDKETVLALARKGHEVATPHDVLKEPFVLEFLDLSERPNWHERDLEQAIIDRLGDFLLELGKGFCFVARQKRISLDGDHFYVDLVFYNRLLRCFVLIDLKLGKLTHQNLGQMTMYVNWFDRFQRAAHERPTVGIVLCSEKNDAVVKITLPEDNEQILAARYQSYLPTEDELRAEVTRGRTELERRLLSAPDAPDRVAPGRGRPRRNTSKPDSR